MRCFLFTFSRFFDFGVFHKISQHNSVLRERLCKGGLKLVKGCCFLKKMIQNIHALSISTHWLHVSTYSSIYHMQSPPPSKPIEVCRMTFFLVQMHHILINTHTFQLLHPAGTPKMAKLLISHEVKLCSAVRFSITEPLIMKAIRIRGFPFCTLYVLI